MKLEFQGIGSTGGFVRRVSYAGWGADGSGTRVRARGELAGRDARSNRRVALGSGSGEKGLGMRLAGMLGRFRDGPGERRWGLDRLRMRGKWFWVGSRFDLKGRLCGH